MTYLVAADLPADPPASASARLLGPPGILQLPGAHNGQAGAAGQGGRVRGALSVRRGDDRLDGPARSRHHHRRRGLLLHPPDRPRHRPAAAGRRRHRLWRGAQRHAHGAQLRGRRRRRGAYRGPVAAEEMRPPERQEAGRRARHGGQDRRRRAGRAGICSSRPHRCRRQRGHRRRGGAREALSGGRRRRDLPRGADHRRDVPRIRPPHARRAAARQHDRVRPHAVLHRRPSSRRWATRW